MKIKCTAIRYVDGLDCKSPATHEVRVKGRHVGYVCGIHKRAWLALALFALTVQEDSHD